MKKVNLRNILKHGEWLEENNDFTEIKYRYDSVFIDMEGDEIAISLMYEGHKMVSYCFVNHNIGDITLSGLEGTQTLTLKHL